tara:strand:+ start:305 stop:466 length:162 start_codon:yes stop_codon:yes gene_type:complete
MDQIELKLNQIELKLILRGLQNDELFFKKDWKEGVKPIYDELLDKIIKLITNL